MRLVTVVLVVAACGETRQVRRWPEHRRQEDQRMLVLERKAAELEQRVVALEAELVARRRAAPASETPPAHAVPSTAP